MLPYKLTHTHTPTHTTHIIYILYITAELYEDEDISEAPGVAEPENTGQNTDGDTSEATITASDVHLPETGSPTADTSNETVVVESSGDVPPPETESAMDTSEPVLDTTCTSEQTSGQALVVLDTTTEVCIFLLLK